MMNGSQELPPPVPPAVAPPWPPPATYDPRDVAFVRADCPRQERVYWNGLVAEGDAEALGSAVLQRLRLEPDADGDALLAIDVENREAIDRCLHELAARRLAREPLAARVYETALGHPVELARMAFEEPGFPAPAAALYAITHDELQAVGLDDLTLDLMALRFAVARTLYHLCRAGGEARATCIRFAERVLARLEGSPGSAGLRADVVAWLARHRPQ